MWRRLILPLLLALPLCALSAQAQGTGSSVQVFGPKTYVRTTGAPNQYTDTIAVPAWIVSPYRLRIQNGDPSGTNRVSAATITINGAQVAAAPADFNQNVATLDRDVNLTPQTTLRVTLESKPGSYLILNLGGTSADRTAPVLTFAAPADGKAVNTATPAIGLAYTDPVGAGEPAASGVDINTLKVTLDGVDRTALFTRRSGDASAVLPADLALAPGQHTLTATVGDLAGNTATATSRFTVDLTAPQIRVAEPAAGAYLATATPTIRVTYQDNGALDLATLKVLVNGTDRTPLFTKTATGATLTLTAATALPQGANQITAQITDSAGNLDSTSVAFNVDLTPPQISIGAPAAGSRHGSPEVPIAISYSDDQALAPATLRVRLDGNLLAGLTVEADGATGIASGVANGSHTLTVRISDRAGNQADASLTFLVDRTAPSIRVAAPAPGAYVTTASPALRLEYSDEDGVDTATLKVRLNAADVTHLFTIGGAAATAHLAGALTLPEGGATLTAEIRDLTGNAGSTTSTFTVDTVAPVVSVAAPVGPVNSAAPAASVTYSDSGSGIDSASLRILLDGADVTRLFAVAAGGAVGTLETVPPLADGPHTLEVSVSDRAGNPATGTGPFVVDTTLPMATFVKPADNSFLNTPAPSIELSYGDGTGSGVDPASLRVFLTRDGEAETEITSLFTIEADKASGQIPSSSALTDATYHLRATLRDRAGNPGTARATFELDTVAPTYRIVRPAQSSALATRTPAILITYGDDRSGVDPSRLVLRIDGVDRSALLAREPDQATVTLPAEEALEDGTHTLEVTVEDRAGNVAEVVPQSFIVDTVPPTITAALAPEPNASGWNTADVTVTFTCADSGSGVADCPVPVVVSTEGAGQVVRGLATDAAGNTAETEVRVSLSKTPPTIAAAVSPEPNAAGWHNTDATVTFTCTAGVAPLGACPPSQVVSAEGAEQSVSGTVTDAAGIAVTATATVRLDRTPPAITAAVAPAPNEEGWNTGGVTVTFTCTDALSGVAECPAPVVVSAEGAGQVIAGTATDVAGNAASASVTIHLAKTPPAITAAVSPAPNAAEWNRTDVTVTFTCTPGGAPIVSCPPPQVVSTEGDGQTVTGTVRDAAGMTATATATVRLDKTPPSIAELAAPDRLVPGATGAVSVTAADNLSIASVAFEVDGSPAATLTEPPYRFDLTVPAEARAGDTLTVTAVVTDAAGNSSSATRGVTVAAQGIVVGQVLSDATGLPLPGATIQVLGGSRQDVSREDGRYSIPVDSSHLFLRITKAGMLPVEREIAVQPAVGTVAVDARLTPAAAPVSLDAGGGTLSAGGISVHVPSGGVAALTRRSAQGLPALLPLGWSPVAAFDLSTEAAGPYTASFTGVPQGQDLQLAVYNTDAHAWTLVQRGLTSADGTLSAELPAPGSYALVLADDTEPPLAIPEAGQPLPGTDMVLLPADAESSGTFTPPSLTPAGGTARATLTVQSSIPLPSGTVLQANVTETYTPSSGEAISEAVRSMDLVLYRYPAPAGAALAADFPVTPSRSFPVADLLAGKVHLDILAGREGVRGQTGGSGAIVIQSGDASLAIASGSLPQDTAIALIASPLAAFLPSGPALAPLAQYTLDFSGAVLSLPAQLSAAAGTAQLGDTLLLAQIQRFGGVPRLVVVSLAQVSGDRIVSQPAPGLPGIMQGGEYVFYRLAEPLGFIAGLVSASGAPVSALVQADELPFVALSGPTGRYTLVALPGTAHVKATVPQTALLATGSVAVTEGETAELDLALSGTVSAATVSPADGALGVDPSVGITITAAVALNPATVTAANIQLFKVGSSGSQPVAVRFVLAQGNRQVSVFPLAALQPSTRYTLQVSGLATAVGGLVAVPSVTFTTRAVTPPSFNPDALVFAFPDAEGNVAVSAPAGSFPPGTRVLIVNQTNGVVISLTVHNDGSVSGELPATIDDALLITLTAPDQSSTTFTRTQYVAPDGTVAVGTHGGTVVGPGGVELRIPEGALDRGVRLKIEEFGADLFPERPEIPEGHFGGGLKVTSPDKLGRLKKEIDLAFPKPADAPDGSFYYVYRRLAKADGTVAFEVIDQAFVEGEGAQAKVVTASAPFPGFITGMAGLATNAATSALASAFEESYFFLQWSFERLLVGVASQGLISGKVRRIVPPGPGQTDPTYVPISGARVQLSDGGLSQIAVSQEDGSFTLWDRRLGGGTRKVTAFYGNESVEATAFEVNVAEPDPFYFPNVQLYRYYRNLAKVNIAFPALTPPPPAPQVDIRLFTLDTDGLRVPATGVLQSGTSLVIAFKSSATVKGATVGGVPLNVTAPDVPDNSQDPLRFDSRVVGTYTVGPPGVYTVVVTALPALGGPAVTATRSFLAVAPGGNNGVPKPGAPAVIHTLPLDNAVSVATTTFPLVQFSEPVTQVPGHVTLDDSSGQAADLHLIGIRADGSVANPVGPGDAITSLTLQPTTGLKFGETYTLTLESGIADLDQPPLQLAPFTLRFTTFGPQALGGTAPFSSTRPVVLGQRVYVAKSAHTLHSSLNIVDISDPASPVEVGTPAFFIGRAADIAGVELSPVTQGPLVAVATGVGSYPLPSNLWIFDVSNPDVPNRVAAVSATTSAGQDGTVLRIAMKGGSIYASTFPKGIQVIDVREAVTAYENRESVDFGKRITTEGQGFGTEAVVNTISLTTSQGSIATMYDLEADDFATVPPDPDDPDAPVPTETLVVATGRVPLVVVNPLQSGPSAVLYPPRESGGTGLSTVPLRSADGQFSMDFGFSVALGSLDRTDAEGNSRSLPVALVAGTGSMNGGGAGTPLLAVVDLTNPRLPKPLGFLQLSEFASDVTLKDSVALIAGGGKIRLVNLADPTRPSEAGLIQGTFGDRLAISDAGVVVTASLNGTIGGVRTTVLGSYIIIRKVVPSLAMVDDEGKTIEPLQVEIEANGQPEDFVNAQLTYSEDGVQKATLPLGNLRPGMQTVTVPAGLRVTSSSELVEMSLVGPDGKETQAVVLQLNSGASSDEGGTTAATAAALSSGSRALSAITEAASAFDTTFSGLSPLSIRQGSGPIAVTVTGAPATQAYVRGLDDNWIALPAVASGAGSFQITVPASLLGQAGFLEVAPAQDDARSIPLLVYDPSLPPVGSAPDLEVDSVVVDDDTLTPDMISVNGVDFVEGMKVVLGRGTTPGVALPTTLLDPGLLQAQVPAPFAVTADDLFVAVLTADGTALSSSIPYPRLRLVLPADSSADADREQAVTWIAPGVEPEEAAATAQFDLTEVGITSIQGDLVGTVGDPVQQQQQSLFVQGVNLVDGLVAKFRTWKGGQVLEKLARLTGTQTIATLPAPPGIEATSPTELRRSSVPVPKEITDTPQKKFRVETSTVQSGAAVADFRQPAVVPFGGRRSFAVYKGPGDDYRILASSEAKANPNYQAVIRAVVSISKTAPNSGGFNTIQLERETGDPQGSVRIRGTALTQLPCDKIRDISPQLPCDSTKREAAQLKAELDGKVVATRDVESMYKPLSARKPALLPDFDPIIVKFADEFGVPPHFLKAQAIQESQSYAKNFRFEFTSINVKWLAGDGNSKGSFSGSQPLIQTDLFANYLVPGKALGAYRPGSTQMQSAQMTQRFPFDPSAPSRTQFDLGPAVKRTVGRVMNERNCDRRECAPQVFAVVQSTEAKPRTLFRLVLVHQDTVWQKAGNLKTPAAISTAAGTLQWTATVKEFAVNYDTGVVTLGSPLQQGQQLVVRYWPVGENVSDNLQATVVEVSAGKFFSKAPDLNDAKLVKEQNKLNYNAKPEPPGSPESLFDFLSTNIASSRRGFLTAPDTGDRFVEFSVDQNNRPIKPRDPRYRFITSQPYASSSYGLLQLTLLPFGPGPRGDKLRSTFDPNDTPIYQLLTQAETNFRLAAQFHNQTLRGLVATPSNRFTPCGLTDCNESRWQQQWYTVFNDYNPSGAGYNNTKPEKTIIEVGASDYAPEEPN